MPSLRIVNVRIANQNSPNVTLFDPYNDALALVMDVEASADLLALPNPSFAAIFEVIDPLTNMVVVTQSWGTGFNWGGAFWISMGQNWGPPNQWETAEKWGLRWLSNPAVYGFRGIIGAYFAPPDGSGLHTTDAFDVSDIAWFRLENIYEL
jgi:hypothetical protein